MLTLMGWCGVGEEADDDGSDWEWRQYLVLTEDAINDDVQWR